MLRRGVAVVMVLALVVGALVLGIWAYRAATEPAPLHDGSEDTIQEPENSTSDDGGRPGGNDSPRRPAAPNPAPQHP